MALVVVVARTQVAGLVTAMSEQAMLARRDDLTGLANDRGFREDLRDLDSSRTDPSLALIDVDQFKAYNDAFGHPAGDEALREIGRILARFASDSTRVYRVGGDEFAVIFDNLVGPGLIETAESICQAVSDHPWTLRPITICIGLDAQFRTNRLDRADQALYRAKRAGGDRVIRQPDAGLPST